MKGITSPTVKVLLIGSNGQVGGELVTLLAQLKRVKLTATDRAALDLADADGIRAAVKSAKPDIIINAAAYTAVDKAESDKVTAHAINAVAPGVLAAEAQKHDSLLVHYSTDYVFDGEKAAPYVEDDATNPLGVYGRTKLEGEDAIRRSGCRHVILRTSWVYGPRGANFLLTMLRLAATRPELRVVDDQFGAPTSARMIAEATQRILFEGEHDMASLPSGLYHMTAAGRITWCGFARAILAGRGLTTPVVAISTPEYPTPAARPKNSMLDNAKFESAFGFRLPVWVEGLRQSLAALP